MDQIHRRTAVIVENSGLSIYIFRFPDFKTSTARSARLKTTPAANGHARQVNELRHAFIPSTAHDGFARRLASMPKTGGEVALEPMWFS